MVCTLLAGINVVAFAADDDILTDTISVQKFYWDATKGGSGEHIYTIDEDEIDWYTSLSDWNYEGVAWEAPLMSETPVYRLCNYNTGEHIWIADKGYADLLVEQGWTIEQGIAFYSDDNKGVPVYRLWNGTDGVGCHHYTTDEGEVAILESQGWIKEDVAFYGVYEEEPVEHEVILTDTSGLQADGTAAVGDTLTVAITSLAGTPASVTWYKDDIFVKTYSGANLTTGLNSTDIGAGLTAGEWYVQVENTNGEIFVSNTITVSAPVPAELSDMNIDDNYEAVMFADQMETPALQSAALQAVSCATTTANAIVDVTINKLYDGYSFYILEVNNDGTVGAVANTINPKTAAAAVLQKVDEDDFSDVTLFVANQTVNTVKGIYYVDALGEYHYKLLSDLAGGQSITRGHDYVVAYANAAPVANTTQVLALNTTDVFTCPYVEAPTEIAVVDAQPAVNVAGWGVQLYVNGIEAGYIYDGAGTGVGAGTELYSNTSALTTGGTVFGGVACNKFLIGGKTYSNNTGAASTAKAADGNKTDSYVYATWAAPAGIFAKTAVSLTSKPQAIAPAVATDVDAVYAVASPTDISATMTDVKADSTAYLVTATFDTDVNTTAQKAVAAFMKTGDYVAVAPVSKGAASVTFKDAIDEVTDTTHGDVYAVVIMPNTTDFSTVATVSNANAPVRITQVPVMYSLDRTAVAEGETAQIIAYDQFLDPGVAMTVIAANTSMLGYNVYDTDNAVAPKIGATAAGLLTLSSSEDKATIGDTWRYALGNGQFIYASAVDGDGSGKATKMTIWID